MNSAASLTLSVVLTLCFEFCSSESAKKGDPSTSDTSKAAAARMPSQSTAIAQNVTNVEAVIEKVTLMDKFQFSLSIFIVTSSPAKGKLFSLIEPQQRATIYPEFHYTDAIGTVDTNDTRNQKLLSLRDAHAGQAFKGKISIDQRGTLKLLEVENH